MNSGFVVAQWEVICTGNPSGDQRLSPTKFDQQFWYGLAVNSRWRDSYASTSEPNRPAVPSRFSHPEPALMQRCVGMLRPQERGQQLGSYLLPEIPSHEKSSFSTCLM